METHSKRLNQTSTAQLPTYLRKLILFDRLISAMLWVIIALLSTALAVSLADGDIGPMSFAGAVLLALCLVANM